MVFKSETLQINKYMGKKIIGLAAFFIVLFCMPLGHAAMIIMEQMLDHRQVYIGAFMLGLLGLVLTTWGIYVKKEASATSLGLIGSLFVWTGWVEFCYVYYANRYSVPPLMVDNEIMTKPEYLIMPSSIGLWAIVMMFYIFSKRSKCSFFMAIQKFLKVHKDNKPDTNNKRSNASIATFMEMNILLWTSYLVLLFAYDDTFFGDKHPLTIFIAFASLAWSVWLFIRLLKIRQIGYAIRYAIPTVIIFWTFIEILGRWNFFEEIWVQPMEYKLEMLLMLLVFIGLFIILLTSKNKGALKQLFAKLLADYLIINRKKKS